MKTASNSNYAYARSRLSPTAASLNLLPEKEIRETCYSNERKPSKALG